MNNKKSKTFGILWLLAALTLAILPPIGLTSCSAQRAGQEAVVQDEYPELPAIKPGARYSSRLENVRRIALEDEANDAIPAGSYKLVTSQLTAKNVLYQTDPEGNLIASIPLLAAMIDRDATYHDTQGMQKAFDDAYRDGLAFTPRLVDIAIANHLYLEGLENAVKGASHIVDKAHRWVNRWREENNRPDATLEEIAAGLYDLVRYTALTDKQSYVPATQALIKSLEENGYEVLKVDNRYLGADGKQDPTKPYRAIHLNVRSGQRLIEIQVHEMESHKIIEETHEIYEKMRQFSTDSEEYKRYDKMRLDAWQKYTNPEGIELIQSYKK